MGVEEDTREGCRDRALEQVLAVFLGFIGALPVIVGSWWALHTGKSWPFWWGHVVTLAFIAGVVWWTVRR